MHLPPRQIVLLRPPSPSLCSPRPGLLRGHQASVRHCVFSFVCFPFCFWRHDHDFKGCLGILAVDIFPSVFLSRVTSFPMTVRLWVVPSAVPCSCLTNVHTWLPSRTLCSGTVPSQHVSTEPHTKQRGDFFRTSASRRIRQMFFF